MEGGWGGQEGAGTAAARTHRALLEKLLLRLAQLGIRVCDHVRAILLHLPGPSATR